MSLTTKLRSTGPGQAEPGGAGPEGGGPAGDHRKSGKREVQPSLKLAMDIANVFGCTVEELFQFH